MDERARKLIEECRHIAGSLGGGHRDLMRLCDLVEKLVAVIDARQLSSSMSPGDAHAELDAFLITLGPETEGS